MLKLVAPLAAPPPLVSAPARAAPPPLPVALAAALAEEKTVIVLVFGTGPDPDRTERRCRALAGDPGFEALRVVRVEDRASLSATMPAAWLVPGRPVAVVGSDRRVALPLERPDAIDLFVAVSALG